MAILEQLRTRAGLLLAIVIGMSLLAFVLSDLLDSGGTLFNRSKYEIAEVSGKSIPYDDYLTRVTELEDIQKLQTGQLSLTESEFEQVREAAWSNMIQDLLLEKQYEKIGITVSPEELVDLITGANPHPYIAQLFTDPSTGIFNRQAFSLFMQRLEGTVEMTDEKKYYLFLENQIVREMKYRKYFSLLNQGIYATTIETEHLRAMQGKTVDAEFVAAGFSAISDSAVTVTNKELKAYYKKNINNYKQEESRDIRFAYYDVVPSEEDYKLAEDNINSLLNDFTNAEDIRLFVSQESDLPFDNLNYAEGEILPDSLNDFMFAAKVGDTFGPYFYEDSYRVSRLAEINYLPDSVRARHILLQVTASNQATILNMADSLKSLIQEGVSFELLAMTNSMDNSGQSGGDLGWFREGVMVQPFSDSVFYGKKGDLKTVITDYGVHIVEITDQSRPVKKIKVGTLVKNVEPGDNTDQLYYASANEFAGRNDNYDSFINAINDSSFTGMAQSVPGLAPMDKSLPGIENARQLIIWAYQAEPGDVSGVYKFDNKYVIGTVENVREKGFIPMDEILTELEIAVRKEKKAEMLAARLAEAAAGASSLESVATALNTQVQSVTGVNYNSDIFGNSGVEPAAVAAALTLESGVVSAPVKGDNGVYIIKVNSVNDVALGEVNLTRQSLENTYGALVSYYSYGALEKLAGVVDNRREFF